MSERERNIDHAIGDALIAVDRIADAKARFVEAFPDESAKDFEHAKRSLESSITWMRKMLAASQMGIR